MAMPRGIVLLVIVCTFTWLTGSVRAQVAECANVADCECLPDLPVSGQGAIFWEGGNVIYARVQQIQSDHTEFGDMDVVLDILGTVSGGFDAALEPELPLHVRASCCSNPNRPVVGDKVLVVLSADVGNADYSLQRTRVAFMPSSLNPFTIVKSFADPRIQETFGRVRKLRSGEEPAVWWQSLFAPPIRKGPLAEYWRTHSLIYAEVVGSTQSAHSATVLDIRPKVRLSGEFDPGKMPEVSVNIPRDISRKIPNHSSLLGSALVLLVKKGDSYSVAPELAEFMPGDHAPVCAVSEFDDPKVSRTLEAVQRLRLDCFCSATQPVDMLHFFLNDQNSQPAPLPDAPGLERLAGVNVDDRLANLSLNVRVAASGTEGACGHAKFTYTGLEVGHFVPMLGAVYRVVNVGYDSARLANGEGIELARVTDANLLREIGVARDSLAVSYGDSVVFKFFERKSGPKDANVVRIIHGRTSSIHVELISTADASHRVPEARIALQGSEESDPARRERALVVRPGDVVQLDDACQLTVTKIVPNDHGRKIMGWIEFNAPVIKVR